MEVKYFQMMGRAMRRQPRYTVMFMSLDFDNGKTDSYWCVWDNLMNTEVVGARKVSMHLAYQVANKLNASYEEAMQRQRKQVFNQTYSIRK